MSWMGEYCVVTWGDSWELRGNLLGYEGNVGICIYICGVAPLWGVD